MSLDFPGLEHTADQDELTQEDEIEISVGGQVHKTRVATLLSKPDTKLYKLAEDHMALTEDERQNHSSYFFDRNSEVFSSVLEYYRTGNPYLYIYLFLNIAMQLRLMLIKLYFSVSL